MTVKAPDLPLRLPHRHFFCASLYSPPRPGILSYCSQSLCAHSLSLSFCACCYALIRSSSLTHCFQSFCDHSLLLLCRVVSAASLWRGAVEFVFACKLVLVLFLEFQLLRRAHCEGSYVVKDECNSTVGVIAVGEKWTISLSKCDCSF
jgi:hypothetical protein